MKKKKSQKKRKEREKRKVREICPLCGNVMKEVENNILLCYECGNVVVKGKKVKRKRI